MFRCSARISEISLYNFGGMLFHDWVNVSMSGE
jgi:hypothetical protein